MKRLLYSAAVLAMAFFAASCQQESLEPVVGSNTVTYTVQVPDALATKGIGDDVSAVTELVYEVYRTEALTADDHSKAETKLYQKTATISGGVATVELELVNNQNFRVLFWAQDPDNTVYTTGDLKNVTLSQNLVANTEDYAAFAGSDFIKDGDPLTGRTISLVRPVAQLNIATSNDGLDLEGQTTVAITNTAVTVTGLSTTFNVAEGKAGSDAVAFEYAATPALTGNLEVSGETYRYLSMNYLGFAGARRNVVVDYTIETSNVGTITNTINNVPVEPNYRTNIVGNLITSVSDYTVTLDAEWGTPEEEVEVWDGKMLSAPSYNTQTKTWSVTKASELAWLAAAVNGDVTVTRAGDTFSTDNVVLTADIDLGNYPWTPIGLTGDQAGFQGTFDGQGHTISNLYVDLTAEPKYESAGLFGSARYASIKNLTIKNATIKNLDTDGDSSNGAAVVVGSAPYPSTIDNVHVVNAVVTSNRRAAGIAGYFVGTITNSSVTGLTATVTPDDYDGDGKFKNGDKAGGILGTTNGATILKNNVVKNANIRGYRNLGGLAGAANLGENSSNKVENTVVTVDRTYTMSEEDPALSGQIVGRILGGILDDSNVATDVVVVSTEDDVDTPQSFAEALANVADGGVVAVSGEITTTSLIAEGKSITIVGTTDDATIDAGNQTDAVMTKGNITFKNLTFKFTSAKDHYDCGFDADNGALTFENCKFEGITTSDGEFVFNNCQFTNTTKGKYAAWVYNGNTVYNNCTFIGVDRAAKVFNENAYSNLNATYNNCTFKASTPNKAAVEVDVTNNTAVPTYVEINNPAIENMGVSDAYSIGNGICNLKTSGKGLGIVNLNGKGYSVASTATQLQTLANAGRDVTIELDANIIGDVKILQKVGADIIINGCNFNYDGTITIDGDNRNTGVETLTISNINFSTSEPKTFISAPGELDGKKERYSHNITINGCTFSTPTYNEGIVAINTQKTYNFVVKNCSASNLHTLLQVQSCDNNVYVENITVNDCKHGVSFGNTAYPTLVNAVIKSRGYGVRGDGDADRGTLVMKNVDIEAKYPLAVRRMKDVSFSAYEVSLDNETTLTTTAENQYHIIFTSNKDEDVLESPARAYSISGADSYKVYPRDNQ